MSFQIWKIDLSQSLVHDLPLGAKPLHADYQNGNLCVWFFIDMRQRVQKRAILVAGTGWTLPDFIREDMHIGSCQNPDNSNIWHIFDLGYLDNLKPYEKRSAELLYEAAEMRGAYDQPAEREDDYNQG